MTNDAGACDATRDFRVEAQTLRAIAHPLRVRLLSRLRLSGPATASQLGRALGESSGATSYHLRRLEAYGFVADDPQRGSARERWWRAVHRSTYYDTDLTGEYAAAGGEYLRAVARNHADRIVRYADAAETLEATHGGRWSETYTISDWTLHLTSQQGRQLHLDVTDLLDRYRNLPRDDRAETVIVQVQLMPPAEPE